MTALLAALGLLPAALSTEIGSETQRPLAVVVVGGLVSATFLTLIVLPVLYEIVLGRRGSDRAPTIEARARRRSGGPLQIVRSP
jgi:cobalt-zinc-cadmium resistance protein CzcA